jgi:hypothetical protein
MVKKEGTSKKKIMNKEELEQVLIDNFINLQRVLTNLSVRFEELSGNISKLLQLFEISARNFAEKYSEDGKKLSDSDRDFLRKLDSLLDQNKTIARGIMMMEEKIREKNSLPSQRAIAPPQRFSQVHRQEPHTERFQPSQRLWNQNKLNQ